MSRRKVTQIAASLAPEVPDALEVTGTGSHSSSVGAADTWFKPCECSLLLIVMKCIRGVTVTGGAQTKSDLRYTPQHAYLDSSHLLTPLAHPAGE